MKEFFKMMLASMAGFILTIILCTVIMAGILVGIVASATKEEVSIDPNSILRLVLDKPILDRSPKNPIFVDLGPMNRPIGLNDILNDIRKAKDDPNIKGILLDISVIPAGMATISEIRKGLLDFKKSGKFIVAYSEVYSQGAYYLATAADQIYLQPEGMILFKGLNAQLTFLKGTLDKLDIKMQVIRHGKFKAATEPLFRENMSPENRLQMEALINNSWKAIINAISESRKIDVAQLNRWADSLSVNSPEAALRLKLVDQLMYKDDLEKDLKRRLKMDDKKKLEYVSVETYTRTADASKKFSAKQGKIAVIYCQGSIGDGDGDDRTIGSERISKAIRKARENEDVKAIVLRVNSPGGSALSSDVIWREVDLAAKAKPVVASFGDVAASGGYYIACPATKILADPTTITGSIGVFGLVPNMKGLFNNKLGITFDEAKTNANSDFISVTHPISPYQTEIIQQEIERIYSGFVSRVATGRHLSKDAVDSIGQGRVWCGADAKKIGLIDDFGGLDDAVKLASDLAHVSNYKILPLPEQKDPFQAIMDAIFDNDNSSILMKELGENYTYYEYFKEIQNMKGIQARMEFEMEIY
jgi:protease IV